MAHIPQSILERCPPLEGLTLRGRGKVRNQHTGLVGGDGLMLSEATNRVSAFDFVLPGLVGLKGSVLTALHCFFTTGVLNGLCPNDLVAFGADIDRFLPETLRGNPDLQSRAVVVKIHEKPTVEDCELRNSLFPPFSYKIVKAPVRRLNYENADSNLLQYGSKGSVFLQTIKSKNI